MKPARIILTVLSLAVLASPAAARQQVFDASTVSFLRQVDTSALKRLAVQYKGRIAILDTLALEYLGQVYGSRSVAGLDGSAAFLELYFNSGQYLDKPVVYVRESSMRKYLENRYEAALESVNKEIAAIKKSLAKQDAGGADRAALLERLTELEEYPRPLEKALAQFRQTRHIPPVALMDDQAAQMLLMTGRASEADIQRAQQVMGQRDVLRDAVAGLQTRREMRVPLDSLYGRYNEFLGQEILRLVPAGKDWTPFEMIPHLLEPAHSADASHPGHLAGPAAQAAQTVLDLAQAWRQRDADKVNRLIGQLDQQVRQAAGAAYPASGTVELEVFYNWTYQATVIWITFAVSMLLLVVAAATGRPWARLSGMGLFTLSTLALLGGFVLRWVLSGRPWYLPPVMNQFESVTSSALLAAVLALGLEIFLKQNYYALAAAFYATVSLLCGFFLPQAMGAVISAPRGILVSPIMAIHVATIIIGHALVGMTLVISAAYLVAAAIQGLDGPPPSSGADLARGKPLTTLAAIDRCNLIVAQLAAWMVLVGTLLGAYWADFAWARWWGWDPKEVWAMITCVIYIGVLHVRFAASVRTRGLWTACGCVLGCGVMLFNWIIVNFFLPGLHSYA